MKRIIIILCIAACFAISARGQGFLNLNFELAYNLPGNPGNGAFVSVTNALPDWSAYYGSSLPLSDVEYVSNNLTALGVVELDGGSLALSGNFSVGLDGGSISQTGLVPGNAESLEFEASIDSPLVVTLGGQTLTYSTLSESTLPEGPDYAVYGANIPADMDGQIETLTFGIEGSETLLDNIEFLPTSVPEPSEYALIGVGGILLGIRYWRKLGE